MGAVRLGTILLLVPVLLGCMGHEDCELTAYGVCITGAAWDAGTVEAMEAQLLDGLSANGWPPSGVKSSLRQSKVTVLVAPFTCGYELDGDWVNGKCAGQEDGPDMWVVAYPCLWETAYRHELGHWIQLNVRGITDLEHKDPTVWPVVDAVPEGACL